MTDPFTAEQRRRGGKRDKAAAAKATPSTDDGLVCLADVAREHVSWLWPARIPFGKLTVLDGDPGLGKSTLTLDLAARLTTCRPMPSETAPALPTPAAVLFLTAEDGLGDTVRPRLEAAGAHLPLVHALQMVTGEDGDARPPSIPADVELVAGIAHARGVRLVVVDPLMAFLGAGVDSHTDKDVRRALHPLARMAEATGAAVLLVRHLNKAAGGSAIYRGGGSIGIVGAARSGLLVARDPQDHARRVLASTKCNLAPEPPSLSYEVETTPGGVGRLRWTGESPHRAEQLVAVQLDQEDRTARDEATGWLEAYLDDVGGEAPVPDIRRAWKAAGLGSDRTLERAKAALGLRAVRRRFGGEYVWRHPGEHVPATCTPGEHGEHGEQGFPCGENGIHARQTPMLASPPRVREHGEHGVLPGFSQGGA